MTLGDTQREFSRDIVYLKLHMIAMGYEFTEGDAYRDPRVHGAWGKKTSYSHAKSHHKLRLADDINLFLDGKYLRETEDHRQFGDYWKALHPDNVWGGDFKDERGDPDPDGNHYQRNQ